MQSDARVQPWTATVSWVLGCIWIFAALATLARREADTAGGSLAVIVGAVIILPPVSSRLRKLIPALRPLWAPPLLGFVAVLAVTMLTVGIWSVSPSGQTTESAAQVPPLAGGNPDKIAQDALAVMVEGDSAAIAKATVLMLDHFTLLQIRSDPALNAAYLKIEAAADRARAADRATAYVKRVEEELVPRAANLSLSQPTTMEELTQRTKEIDFLSAAVAEGGEHMDSPTARDARAKLKTTLSQRQSKVFPVLRRSYIKIAEETLWEHDITAQSGSGRRVRFVGGIFAANRNIKAVHEKIYPMLLQLRFSRAEYAWVRGAEFTYYDLQSPPDDAVGS